MALAYHERILVDIRAGANLTAALASVTAALANVTRSQHEEVLTELETVRGQLAAAAVLSFTQLAIVVIYLITYGILFIMKRCEKHQVAALETNLTEMESRLQVRKAQRRLAAAKAKRSPSPAQE